MNPSPFSSRPVLPGPGQPLHGDCIHRFGVKFARGNEALWLGTSRPHWFLLLILPLLFWRMLRVFGKPLRPKLEERAA